MAANDIDITQSLTIRRETTADYNQITTLLDAAFGGKYESELVKRMREQPHFINDLTLVAQKQNEIVGFIMVSYVTLENTDVASTQLLALGPVAVKASQQKHGIGGALIRESIRIAEDRKESMIVLLGHDTYYPRFGFERASLHGIFPSADWPDNAFMVLRLAAYKQDMKGTITYPEAWQISR